MRVVFLGTPDFAIPALEGLIQSSHQVVGIVTQPDRPVGRGQKVHLSPVRRASQSLDVPLLQPQRLASDPGVETFLAETRPDVMVVAAFGQILKPEFFEYPPLGTLNIHASLLPQYRGAAPIAHALIQGELETGVTIMKINAGLDTGAILSQAQVPIAEDATAGELEKILAQEGADLLLRTLPAYASGELQPQPQDDLRATQAPRILKEEARIDWAWEAGRVHNWVRGLNPWPVSYAVFRGERVRIWSTLRCPELEEDFQPSGRPGQVLRCSSQELLVECGARTVVRIRELQLPNRQRISAGDFVNGVRARAGEVFA